jgi:flagellar basal-body rod protein FlgF
MPGGSYSALSGMQTRLEELDRIAGDLANIGTPGYKVGRAGTQTAERETFGAALESAIDVVSGIQRIDFRPGTIATTGRDLDVAIDGTGFFVVETEAGERYTRSGNFTRRADGVLATTHGEAVLGEAGPIRLGTGEVRIESNGTVKTGGVVVGQLRIVEFDDAENLIRESGARFMAAEGAAPHDAERAHVIAGSLEQSNASVVDLMTRMTEVTRGFESLQRGVGTMQNELDGRAISELLGRA